MQFSEYQPPKFEVRGDAQAITTGTAAKQETCNGVVVKGTRRLPAAVDEALGERTCCCG